jgi:hypothetical protein
MRAPHPALNEEEAMSPEIVTTKSAAFLAAGRRTRQG